MTDSPIPSLSVRSYTKQTCRHKHNYFQLVLPINGHILIEIDNFSGRVGVGEGVCIAPNEVHYFIANELSKFIVADLEYASYLNDRLNLILGNVSIMAFLWFVEIQISQFADQGHEEILALFLTLLETSLKGCSMDKRMTPVLSHIHRDLARGFTQVELARIACMGTTQFKTRFKEATGHSLRDYLVKVRMEKAKALLRNTIHQCWV